MSNNERPIIIKKIKKISGGHHGGAWKVAYADFVTAMMAFFLLMWLINTTSPDQKRGIADYFAPASVSKSKQGSDGMLGGTSFQKDGARHGGSNRPMPETQQTQSKRRSSEAKTGEEKSEKKSKDAEDISQSAMDKALAMREQAEFERAEQSLRQAMQDMPDLAELSKHLIIDQTPEGLRIQLVDQEGRAMFAQASAKPLPRTEKLLAAVSDVIMRLPNRVSISGHHRHPPFRCRWLFKLGIVVRPGQRRTPHPVRIRTRRGPHLPSVRQIGIRTALSRRPRSTRQQTHFHRAPARGACHSG